ncbi:MAG: cysteine desulfurase [Petroclostridium sp.]|jgi:cysteine desulfurase|uniref:cysteine desulfurase family protein n=1 Tax=Petroclostridium xylanilyticum TaxID=1792311 RepID=UPI000B982217|nr:cysteine desulfurase family protein [Petroclostridium xylanilyticum]MBZ4647616.1 cysteine desulfurase NifS [Clostridia bacterium]MDK2811719.1 cysteine desulfurase [Petroclostridium sp.]
MQKEIYLDNSATTKPYIEVVDAMVETLTDNYGNPSSLHIKGINAERAIKKSREIIARALDVKSSELFFTSGGTESNNIAIRGIAAANKKRGNHLITSVIEHPSVLNTFKYLEEEGFRVSYIQVDKNGIIDLGQLEKAICNDTILVSIMHVNNEVGTIQPIKEVRDILDLKQSKAIFHVDAIQSFGKISFTPKQFGIDLLSVSAHKIHGPKGVGALFIKKGVLIKPIVYGGNQELNMRSGTENVPGIIGFGKSVELTFQNLNNAISTMNELKETLKKKIIEKIDKIIINGQVAGKNAPHILNVSFPGIRAEVLLHALEDKGIFVSTGSACSSNKPSPSHVLTAMGVERECIEGAIRFSVSAFNTLEDIEYCVEQLSTIIQQLRKYTRR